MAQYVSFKLYVALSLLYPLSFPLSLYPTYCVDFVLLTNAASKLRPLVFYNIHLILFHFYRLSPFHFTILYIYMYVCTSDAPRGLQNLSIILFRAPQHVLDHPCRMLWNSFILVLCLCWKGCKLKNNIRGIVRMQYYVFTDEIHRVGNYHRGCRFIFGISFNKN